MLLLEGILKGLSSYLDHISFSLHIKIHDKGKDQNEIHRLIEQQEIQPELFIAILSAAIGTASLEGGERGYGFR